MKWKKKTKKLSGGKGQEEKQSERKKHLTSKSDETGSFSLSFSDCSEPDNSDRYAPFIDTPDIQYHSCLADQTSISSTDDQNERYSIDMKHKKHSRNVLIERNRTMFDLRKKTLLNYYRSKMKSSATEKVINSTIEPHHRSSLDNDSVLKNIYIRSKSTSDSILKNIYLRGKSTSDTVISNLVIEPSDLSASQVPVTQKIKHESKINNYPPTIDDEFTSMIDAFQRVACSVTDQKVLNSGIIDKNGETDLIKCSKETNVFENDSYTKDIAAQKRKVKTQYRDFLKRRRTIDNECVGERCIDNYGEFLANYLYSYESDSTIDS